MRLLEPGVLRLATLGLTEVLHYGEQAPQVIRVLLAVCRDLAAIAPADRRSFFDDFGRRCIDTAGDQMPGLGELAIQPDRMGLG